MEMIKEKAEDRSIPLEEMLELDAKWIIDNEEQQ